MSSKLFVAILAAGEASRFGGGKLDALLNAKPLGRHALDTALALGAGIPAIVTGDPPSRFAAEAAQAGEATLIVNPDAKLGLGTSVALAALHAEQSGCGKLLLMLADMPLVREESLDTADRRGDCRRPDRCGISRRNCGHSGLLHAGLLQAIAGTGWRTRGRQALTAPVRDHPGRNACGGAQRHRHAGRSARCRCTEGKTAPLRGAVPFRIRPAGFC